MKDLKFNELQDINGGISILPIPLSVVNDFVSGFKKGFHYFRG